MANIKAIASCNETSQLHFFHHSCVFSRWAWCILRDSFNHLRFRTSNKWLFLFPWSGQTTVLGSRKIMCTNQIFTMTSPLYFEYNFGVKSHSSSPFHWITSLLPRLREKMAWQIWQVQTDLKVHYDHHFDCWWVNVTLQ